MFTLEGKTVIQVQNTAIDHSFNRYHTSIHQAIALVDMANTVRNKALSPYSVVGVGKLVHKE